VDNEVTTVNTAKLTAGLLGLYDYSKALSQLACFDRKVCGDCHMVDAFLSH